MVLSNNASNKFGPSPFVVGQVLGAGCNYAGGTGLQQAINDCLAAGQKAVIVQGGTYTVNLTLQAVELQAVAIDGRSESNVTIVGTHTFAPVAAGEQFCLFSGINFTSTNTTFTVTGAAGVNAILAFENCNIQSSAAGQSCISCTGGAGFADFLTISSQMASNGSTVVLNANSACNIDDTDLASSTAFAVNILGANSSAEISNTSQLQGNTGCINLGTASSDLVIQNCSLASSAGPTITFVATGNASSYNNVHSSPNGSGFYVVGPGTYAYAGEVLTGAAFNIDPAVSQIPRNWRPFCTTSASNTTGVRGTAAFDSAFFTQTNGWVTFTGSTGTSSFVTESGTATPSAGVINVLGGPGVTTSASGNTINIQSVTFSDQGGSTVVTPNSGSLATGAGTITLTCPAAPNNGDVLEIGNEGSVAVVIQANAGQKIQIGTQISATAGTATSLSATGDAVILRYQSSTGKWFSFSSVGNWDVV